MDNQSLDLLLQYFLRSVPGLIIGLFFIIYLGKGHIAVRIFSYIFLFILLRDVMTPLRIWDFGTHGVFWLRVVNKPLFLVLMAILSIGMIVALNYMDKEAFKLYVFKRSPYIKAILIGLLGALCIIIPMLLLYQFVPIHMRGGAVERDMLLPLLFFCLSANFFEESLYRGYFQRYMELTVSPLKAAILSGLLFSFSHIFLSATVSDAGWGVLVFTAYEGVIAGMVRMKEGVLASTVTHGVAIFVLSSGLV